MAPRRLLRLLSASAIILASSLPTANAQNVKKIVIHVPYKVHNMHHTHTVYKYISPKPVEPNVNYEIYEPPPSAPAEHKKNTGHHHHHLHHHVHKHKHQHEHKGNDHKGQGGHDNKGHGGNDHKGNGGHDHKPHDGHDQKGHGGHDHKGHGGHDHKGNGGHDHKGHGGHGHKVPGVHGHKGHGGHDHKGPGGHGHKGPGGHGHMGHGHNEHGGHDHKGSGHDKNHGPHLHGQPPHGQHPHGQPSHGHHPHGHHPHGHPPHGHSGHGHGVGTGKGHGHSHAHGPKDCHEKHGHDKHGHDKGHLHYYTTFIVGKDGVVPEQVPHIEYVNREYENHENGAQQYIVPVAEYTDTPANEESQGENYNYEEYDASQKVVDTLPATDDVQQANQEVIHEVPAPAMTSLNHMIPVADTSYVTPTVKQVRRAALKKSFNPHSDRKKVDLYQVVEPNPDHLKPTSKHVKHVSSQVQSLKWRTT